MNGGLFQPLPDTNVMYPQRPHFGASVPAPMPQPGGTAMPTDMSVMAPADDQVANIPALVPNKNPFPSYVGNPTVDRYIHEFIGS